MTDDVKDESQPEEKPKRRYQRSSHERAKLLERRRLKAAEKATNESLKAAKNVALKKKRIADLKKKRAELTTNTIKKIEDPKAPKLVTEEELEHSKTLKNAVENGDVEVAFQPFPGPQYRFLAAPETEVLYGGAAGGGKSFAMLMDPLRYADNANHRALLLRKSMPELLELIDKSKQLYLKVYPKARYSETNKRWTFPSGATLQFSYIDVESDVYRFQGQSFTWIGIDEITHYATPYVWDYLRSRLRRTDLSITPYMRCCVDEGDVLTTAGWKPIQDISTNDYVYSVDIYGNLVIKPVTSSTSYDVNEKLVRVYKKNLYMSMTQDHRVVYKKHFKTTNDIIRWNEYTGKSINITRTSKVYNANGFGDKFRFTNGRFIKFLGLYLAEGSFSTSVKSGYKVIISQLKESNHDFIKDVLRDYNWCYSKNGDFQITNKELWLYVRQFGKSKDKHFPRDFLQTANYSELTSAFEAYILGDGNWQSSSGCTAYTTSSQLVDDLQEIGIKLGYKTQFKQYNLSNPNHNDKYCVYFSKNSETTKVDRNERSRNNIEFEDYDGKVYCVTVQDTENFVIRQKGSVWVSGNTANPGGVGGWWVKKMFIEPSPANTPFWATDIETGLTLRYPDVTGVADDLRGTPLFKRKFIPARLTDNPALMASPEYMAMLSSLPETQRRRLLEGDWDVSDDCAFPEFRKDLHTVEPFEIPSSWHRFRACDYGYVAHTAVLWLALDPKGRVFVYRELYAKNLNAEDLAYKILLMEEDESKPLTGFLDSNCWERRGQIGPSIAETMINKGVKWVPASKGPGSRVNGKLELHRLFATDYITHTPNLMIMQSCPNLIRTLPALPLDKNNPEDVDTHFPEDHLYDALRYGVMSRQIDRHQQYNRYIDEQPDVFDQVFGY